MVSADMESDHILIYLQLNFNKSIDDKTIYHTIDHKSIYDTLKQQLYPTYLTHFIF